MRKTLSRTTAVVAVLFLAIASAAAAPRPRDTYVLTSTNDPSRNQVVVFKLNEGSTPSLSFANALPTGGTGGAGGNAGAVQFEDAFGAVVNFGSNNVTQLARFNDRIAVIRNISLAPNCTKPASVALTQEQMFVVGANCAESHAWPWGYVDGNTVPISDPSAAQIVAGKTWAAVTMTSGSVLQLPLTRNGALDGTDATVNLPSGANDTPLGAAFWGDILGFEPAHSADSFALVDKNRNVYPVTGPQPAFPANAPCWLAKGSGNIWYSSNTPGKAISIFFSDGQGGTFYKSVPVPGAATDITVSHDGKWLAVIYTAADGSGGRIAVYAIDAYGDLSLAATSKSIGVASFNGVAFSQ